MRLPKAEKKSLREIALIKHFEKSALSRINRFLQNNDEADLERMLSHATCKKGATTVLTAEEEKMVKPEKKAKKPAQKRESDKCVKDEVSV